jgi:hypothetical protein
MNISTIKIVPPNSIVFVCDAEGGTIPDPEIIGHRQGIVSTDSCAVVCCLAEMDGETEFTMGPTADLGLNDDPTYDGTLATPSGVVVISTVEWKNCLRPVCQPAELVSVFGRIGRESRTGLLSDADEQTNAIVLRERPRRFSLQAVIAIHGIFTSA